MTDHTDCEAKIASLKETIVFLETRLASCQKEVEKSNSVHEEFIVLVSHELRTPITIIKECVSQLQDRLFGNLTEEQDKLLCLAMQNIDRLTGSINDYIENLRLTRKNKNDDLTTL